MNRFTKTQSLQQSKKNYCLSGPLLKSKSKILFHSWVSATTYIPLGHAPSSFIWTNLPVDQWGSNQPSTGEVFYQAMAHPPSMGPHSSKDLLKAKVSLTIFQLEPLEKKKIGSLKPQIILTVLDLLFPLQRLFPINVLSSESSF